MLTQLANWPTS